MQCSLPQLRQPPVPDLKRLQSVTLKACDTLAECFLSLSHDKHDQLYSSGV